MSAEEWAEASNEEDDQINDDWFGQLFISWPNNNDNYSKNIIMMKFLKQIFII